MNNTAEIVNRIKLGDEKTIHSIYNEFKPEFMLFARRYELDETSLLDIYQDAIIALCENAKKGTIDELTSSLKTYFFAIGKYMVFAKLKEQRKNVPYEDINNVDFEWNEYSEEKNNLYVRQLQESFSQMGEQCRRILELFYYEEKNLDQITKLMNYDNKDVAKSQKSRCIKTLKEIIKKNRNG